MGYSASPVLRQPVADRVSRGLIVAWSPDAADRERMTDMFLAWVNQRMSESASPASP